jgi:hypothetical protein
MTVAIQTRAVVAGNADVLHALCDESVSIAVWNRESPVNDMALDGLRNLRFTASIASLAGQLDRELATAGYQAGACYDLLATDIVALARRFGRVMHLDEIEIRLEHVTTDACKKFHGDYVTARLICTYIGPGTQWLDGADAEECGCGEPHDIQQMRPGDVAMFKGRIWSENHPAIHRSPPIEALGLERLVLVINPPMPR